MSPTISALPALDADDLEQLRRDANRKDCGTAIVDRADLRALLAAYDECQVARAEGKAEGFAEGVEAATREADGEAQRYVLARDACDTGSAEESLMGAAVAACRSAAGRIRALVRPAEATASSYAEAVCEHGRHLTHRCTPCLDKELAEADAARDLDKSHGLDEATLREILCYVGDDRMPKLVRTHLPELVRCARERDELAAALRKIRARVTARASYAVGEDVDAIASAALAKVTS